MRRTNGESKRWRGSWDGRMGSISLPRQRKEVTVWSSAQDHTDMRGGSTNNGVTGGIMTSWLQGITKEHLFTMGVTLLAVGVAAAAEAAGGGGGAVGAWQPMGTIAQSV